MVHLHNRLRLAPPVAAALILSALGACASGDKCCEDKSNEVIVTADQLPAAVGATLARESAGGSVKEIEKESKDGKTVYSADVLKDGKAWDIAIAEDGTVISRELEK